MPTPAIVTLAPPRAENGSGSRALVHLAFRAAQLLAYERDAEPTFRKEVFGEVNQFLDRIGEASQRFQRPDPGQRHALPSPALVDESRVLTQALRVAPFEPEKVRAALVRDEPLPRDLRVELLKLLSAVAGAATRPYYRDPLHDRSR